MPISVQYNIQGWYERPSSSQAQSFRPTTLLLRLWRGKNVIDLTIASASIVVTVLSRVSIIVNYFTISCYFLCHLCPVYILCMHNHFCQLSESSVDFNDTLLMLEYKHARLSHLATRIN